ncbi:MAG: carboxymuconolactone decarboxylase family protein, partial [Chloroflexi bacterium]|nr:carboxymuconolactone decarboxylase family protein [Chloroflexota bacterium]
MNRRTLKKFLSETPGERERTAAIMLELLKDGYGEPPLVVRTLARRPELLTAQAMRILTRTRILDPKVVELLTIASAAALRCEYCLRAHMDRAAKLGVGNDEIFEALTIAASIA